MTLLKSCTRKALYGLCKHEERVLQPLFISLRYDELAALMRTLVEDKDIKLQTDLNALLAVIEALSIRYANTENQEEQGYILKWQDTLFESGIKAHQGHRLVRQTLMNKQYVHQQMSEKKEVYRLSDPEDVVEENSASVETRSEAIKKFLHDLNLQLECPISSDIMRDPVILEDGHSYERDEIENWFSRNDTSPNTGEKVSKKWVKNSSLAKVCTIYNSLTMVINPSHSNISAGFFAPKQGNGARIESLLTELNVVLTGRKAELEHEGKKDVVFENVISVHGSFLEAQKKLAGRPSSSSGYRIEWLWL